MILRVYFGRKCFSLYITPNVRDNRVLAGSNPTEVVSKLFSISFTPLDFASVFGRDFNWPQLFQDFSLKLTLILS